MSAPKFTFAQFRTRFPDEDACLKYIFDLRYSDLEACPKCSCEAKFHQCKGERYFACQDCGHHLHPTAGTIFHKSRTPLTSWLFAVLLFSNSKNGVSAKELQRQLGVTYKTAFRMGHLIRSLMNEEGEITLSGIVEIDETLVGGKKKGGKRGWGSQKPCVFGMVERGGKIVTRVVPNRKGSTLLPIITANTTDDVEAHTDDFSGYNRLGREVGAHHVVSHTKGQHVTGPNGEIHTQTIDGHWSIIKRSIKGTHTSVSPEYLQAYLNEFSFRRNHRNERMFDAILGRV